MGRFVFHRRLGSVLFWPEVTSALEGISAVTRRSKMSATLMIDAGLRLFDTAAAGTRHPLPVLGDLSAFTLSSTMTSRLTSLAEVVHVTRHTSSSLSLVVFFASSWWRHFIRRFWNQTFTCNRTQKQTGTGNVDLFHWPTYYTIYTDLSVDNRKDSHQYSQH